MGDAPSAVAAAAGALGLDAEAAFELVPVGGAAGVGLGTVALATGSC